MKRVVESVLSDTKGAAKGRKYNFPDNFLNAEQQLASLINQ
jgi:hypothetical protein